MNDFYCLKSKAGWIENIFFGMDYYSNHGTKHTVMALYCSGKIDSSVKYLILINLISEPNNY